MIHPPKYKSFEDKEKIYLDNICIETEEDLKRSLNSFAGSGRAYIYRGLCDASYKMYTSAQRYWIDNKGAELKNNTFTSYADYLQN